MDFFKLLELLKETDASDNRGILTGKVYTLQMDGECIPVDLVISPGRNILLLIPAYATEPDATAK